MLIELKLLKREDLVDVKPGDWLYDTALVKKRKPGRGLEVSYINDIRGFVFVSINDYKPGELSFTKELFLDTLDNDSTWVHFEEGRFYKVIFKKEKDDMCNELTNLFDKLYSIDDGVDEEHNKNIRPDISIKKDVSSNTSDLNESVQTIREDILKEAVICVCGQRQIDYGSPLESFSSIASLWSAYLGIDIKPVDAAMLLALLKVSRIKTGEGTRDSFVDLAGYAACGGEVNELKK